MTNKLSRVDQICIVGLGLMGGSYAKRLAFKGFNVNGIDIKEENIKFAKKQHWINEGSQEADLVSNADLIILALYPQTLVEWVKTNHHLFKKGCIITDVTGVKRVVVNKVESILDNECFFVASHPMAGRELMGIEYADPSVFNDANFIITPTKNSNVAAIEKVEDLAKVLEFKKISRLSLDEHDEMIAYLSQLTHVIAINLMNCQQKEHLEDYTGDSFRDLTRIAKINEKMWTELFIDNKDYLLREMNLFEISFNKFKEALIKEDTATLEEMMISSRIQRKKFDK